LRGIIEEYETDNKTLQWIFTPLASTLLSTDRSIKPVNSSVICLNRFNKCKIVLNLITLSKVIPMKVNRNFQRAFALS